MTSHRMTFVQDLLVPLTFSSKSALTPQIFTVVLFAVCAADRSKWTVQQMQQVLRLSGKTAAAAACVERVELVQLAQDVLDGYLTRRQCS